MSKYIITQNVADCIGCRACEVHCKEKNNPGTGAFFCRILEVASPATGSVPGIDVIYLGCFHCEKPWCVDACPTGAMRRRDQDGIVYVEEKDCVGCKVCASVCPVAGCISMDPLPDGAIDLRTGVPVGLDHRTWLEHPNNPMATSPRGELAKQPDH